MPPVREIVLDTETTGFYPERGDRIVEIGAVELVDKKITGKTFHAYVHPQRDVPYAACRVHGITSRFLRDKPRFGAIASDFLAFVADSPLVIHHAPFDVAFLNHELAKAASPKRFSLDDDTVDTLVLARAWFPDVPNHLNALCRRFDVDLSGRALHGALRDALLLAKVYIKMTRWRGWATDILMEKKKGVKV